MPLAAPRTPSASDARAWAAPPSPDGPDGTPRRVGVEIEFGGLTAAQAAEAVVAEFGGEARRRSDWRVDVADAEFGDFRCELDVAFAHRDAEGGGPSLARDAAASVSAGVLPMEITCPPVPLSECGRIDALCAALAEAGAQGSRASMLYAFGLQLNPELPSLDAVEIARTLRAYAALSPWLRKRLDVDLSRRLWSFEARFPEAFRRAVLAPGFAPDLAALIDLYLEHNPTRNRELDVLPLFAHLDEDRVRATLPDETIKARPTWHWRLPDSRLDQDGWRPADAWARWLAVERLAADPARLDEAARLALAGETAALEAMGDALCDD